MVNAVTGQSLAIVSDVRGTTTDPVSKAMELLPLGPVVITDTPVSYTHLINTFSEAMPRSMANCFITLTSS